MKEIVAPDFGESVFEASVGRWFKAEGDTVQTGEPIVELHTDKAVQEINAIRDGTVGMLLKNVDDVVRPGDALCEFQPGDATIPNAIADLNDDAAIEEPEQVSEATVTDEGDVSLQEVVEKSEDDGFVEIDFSQLVNTESQQGPQDAAAVEMAEGAADVTSDAVVARPPSDHSGTDASSTLNRNQVSELRQILAGKPVRRERLSRRRLTAARLMAQVQAEAVMTTTYNEVDMYEVIRIRREFGESFIESHGVKLGFMSFFVKAVLNGLKSFPILNAELDGDELVYKDFYDIGIAVASDHGLVVPVVREADQKTFAEVEREIRGFSEKARTGSFALTDLVGGTFTITNGGVFGSMMSTPILNPPQVGILGMHNIVDRAVIVDGEIAVRPMMYLAVTYDHRVVEGAQAVQFLIRIKESLESAEALMLGG